MKDSLCCPASLHQVQGTALVFYKVKATFRAGLYWSFTESGLLQSKRPVRSGVFVKDQSGAPLSGLACIAIQGRPVLPGSLVPII